VVPDGSVLCYASPMAGGTGVVIDTRMLEHQPGMGHPERPERLRVLIDRFASGGDLVRLSARPAREDEIARVHAPALIERVAATAQCPYAVFDPDTRASAGSWDAARLAAGALLELCDAVLDGQVDNGMAMVRPPGHHAEYDRAMGFCLFNNVAIAAAHLRARGVARIAIVDWDLHHGNGTQHLFARDPTVLYISTHQYPFYPGTGAVEEVGEGPGAGYTFNLPFPPGFGDAEFGRAFDELVVPLLRQFRPEFVLVSAGFDCDARDPLGLLQVTPAGFARMARACLHAAQDTAGGRLAAVLEGGYDLTAITEGVEAVLEVFRGRESLPPLQTGDARSLDRLATRVRVVHSPYWHL